VALARVAPRDATTRRAVGVALAERGPKDLRADAALALALLPSAWPTPHLLRELAVAPADADRVPVLVALAWRGDPAAVPAVAALAADVARPAWLRAAAIRALGRLVDPEPRSIVGRIVAEDLLPPAHAERVVAALGGV
jgi:hypothetical protein